MEKVYVIRRKVAQVKGRKVQTQYFTSDGDWDPNVRLARRWADKLRAAMNRRIHEVTDERMKGAKVVPLRRKAS